MKNPGGCLILDGADGTHQEFDTFTCSHCNNVTILWGHKLQGGFCRDCMHRICDTCVDKCSCIPYERQMDLEERQKYPQYFLSE